MAKAATSFVCRECGYNSPKYLGKCPNCGNWSTMEEFKETTSNAKRPSLVQHSEEAHKTKPMRLDQVAYERVNRVKTSISELDRVLGGGVVPGSLVLIGGDPGIGKSTLLLQVSSELQQTQGTVLYVSGEESASQIKMRAERLGMQADGFYIYAETNLEDIVAQVEALKPDYVIIDSIQTMTHPQANGVAGSVSHVREATATLMRLAKLNQIAIFIVGHVTKEGALAGPRMLEHMVDTVLYFEGEGQHSYRILRAVKNRFGSTNDIGIFEMKHSGLEDLANPSQMFLEERSKNLAGATIISTMEGSRPLLVEIQSLTTPTAFNNPRRISTGLEYNKLILLMAVLEKKAGYLLQQQDVYVKVSGGVKIDDPAVDLGVVMAVASSFKDIAVDMNDCFIGEVGLTGEVRRVSRIEQRINEAKKHGFKRVIVPVGNMKNSDFPEGIEIIPVKDIRECLDIAFSSVF